MSLTYTRLTPANIDSQAVVNRLNKMDQFAANTPSDLRCSPFGNLITAENLKLYALNPYDAGTIAAAIIDESNNPVAVVLAQDRNWRQAGDLWLAALDVRPDLGGRYAEVLVEIANAARNAGFLRFGGAPRPGVFFDRIAALPNVKRLYGDELWMTL